jgi:hypothetical protein
MSTTTTTKPAPKLTKKQLAERAAKRSAAAVKANASRTPAQRSEAARKAQASRSPEARKQAAQRAAATLKARRVAASKKGKQATPSA